MFKWTIAMLAALCAWSGIASDALAAPSVSVVATDPAGEAVTLGRNQNFYLLLEYETDRPVHIWVRPYFQGKEVNAGSNPSGTYTGSGRALGWFFLMQPGDQVDEIRIRAGDGSPAGTRAVATYPVRITGGEQPAEARTGPAWVTELAARDRAQQRAAYEKQMGTPASAGDIAMFNGFMLLMFAIGLLGTVGPAWAVWRWRGGWRLAAAAPAAMMAFVVLRLLIDTSRDPTSHNLWPFEILMSGALSAGAMVVLFALRKAMSPARE
ncbi:MAG TPA: hypothetical protein VLB69_04385 [Rudaea sp.]|nr:hypothetical protein [Rudaea sp.]